mmetsp:Transcript_2371/g.2844  ORF Transcript_2371/g.2844 Transcript_2371/m.2844 type:complete len:256 (-) Transcript_2371:253-1020(-)
MIMDLFTFISEKSRTPPAVVLAISTSILIVILPAFKLWYQYKYPTILQFPWPTITTIATAAEDKQKTVAIAGSFNPPHNGHLVMIQYLAMRYKRVIVVIGMNPNKTYKVSPQQRKEILQRMIDTIELGQDCNVRVEVVTGYIWRYAMSQNTDIFFRGIRTWEKDGPEERKLHFQNIYGPLTLGPLKWPIPTYYMEGNPKYTDLSSTFIRDLCCNTSKSASKKIVSRNITEDSTNISELSGLVPKGIEKDVIAAYS